MSLPIAMIFAEGFLDRVAAEKIASALGLTVTGAVKDAGGIDPFWKEIGKYNEAAKQLGLILALADHDSDKCVGPKLLAKLPRQHKNLLLRLSVHELESWLLADPETLATHLRVPSATIQKNPDAIADPKQTLVDLARRSTKPPVRLGMVPQQGLSMQVGKEYALVIESYIRDHWRPLVAAQRSPSLDRAIRAIRHATGAVSPRTQR